MTAWRRWRRPGRKRPMAAPSLRPRRSSAAAAVLGVAALTGLMAGCRELPDRRAGALVRRYNEKLIEAYRTGDERIVEGLVGDAEAKKILGLIGVKTDMGITLDATLTEFRVTGVERAGPEAVDVLTEERWHYRDRRIGSGETVGEESDDRYVMRYALRKAGKSWVVFRVAFERPPEVGRTSAPNVAPPRVFHGMAEPPPGAAVSGSPGKAP